MVSLSPTKGTAPSLPPPLLTPPPPPATVATTLTLADAAWESLWEGPVLLLISFPFHPPALASGGSWTARLNPAVSSGLGDSAVPGSPAVPEVTGAAGHGVSDSLLGSWLGSPRTPWEPVLEATLATPHPTPAVPNPPPQQHWLGAFVNSPEPSRLPWDKDHWTQGS